MQNGTLGEETEPGKYEDSDIPGAKDPGEAYDSRFHKVKCTIGSYSKSGPKGVVTKFNPDNKTAKETIEYGKPEVNVDGNTVCIVIPRIQVITVEGMLLYFQWYDVCCTLVFSDCVTLLEFLKEEKTTREERTILEPLIRCVTDWPKWAIEKILQLIASGKSLKDAEDIVKKLMAMAQGGKDDRSIETTPVATVGEVSIETADAGEPPQGERSKS